MSGNDPGIVAGAFAETLSQVDRFDHVAFAVLERGAHTPAREAFRRAARDPPSPPRLRANA